VILRFELSGCAADACACLNEGALVIADLRGLRKNPAYVTMRSSLGEGFMETAISIDNCPFRETRSWQGFPGEID
jgi:hypothetical protein